MQKSKKEFRKRPIWTGLLCLAWAATGAVVFLTHIAISKIVPPIGDLPVNVLKGFNQVLSFENLARDGLVVKENAKLAMDTCMVAVSGDTCTQAALLTGLVGKTSTTSEQLTKMQDAFNASLTLILKVTTDRCLKAPGFNETATNLQKIKDTMKDIVAVNGACPDNWGPYCAMYEAGKAIAIGAGNVTKQIDDLAASDGVTKMTDHKDKLLYLHGLPYILVASMVFFTMFWWCSSGVCCCCRGGKFLGCVLFLIPHVTLWMFYLTFACIIAGVGWYTPKWAKENKMPEAVSGGCTYTEMMDHVASTYAPFYDLVFKDLLAGCLMFWHAFVAAMLMCLFIGMYAACLCICRPYSREKQTETE